MRIQGPALAGVPAIVRAQAHKRRAALMVSASVGASLVLGAALVGKWPELKAGVTGAPAAVVAAAVLLQVLALVSRSEAWSVSVLASGGTVSRRRLYRASSMGFVGGLLNTQVGTAARIAALRRSAPADCPRVPTLIAAELPIMVAEATLAALTSFTLVGPLGLPWWLPLALFAGVVGLSALLVRLGAAKARWLHRGLAVLRTLHGQMRLVSFVLVAVLAQIARNWLMLHAVGINASLFDSVAVLIALVSLGQLPFGLSVGTAASVLILGPHGVTAAAAAGVLLTATGTVGGLCFAAWGGLDMVFGDRLPRLVDRLRRLRAMGAGPWPALAALPASRRMSIERSYFGGLSHVQIVRVLGPAAA
jgi:hypothetical protein